MASSKALLAVTLCALLAVASAHDFAGPHTLELTASTYEEQVRQLCSGQSCWELFLTACDMREVPAVHRLNS